MPTQGEEGHRRLLRQTPADLLILPEEGDVTKAHAFVVGLAGVPFDGGLFQFFLKFPPYYPLRPPRVHLDQALRPGELPPEPIRQWQGMSQRAWKTARTSLKSTSVFGERPNPHPAIAQREPLFCEKLQHFHTARDHKGGCVRYGECLFLRQSCTANLSQVFRKDILKFLPSDMEIMKASQEQSPLE